MGYEWLDVSFRNLRGVRQDEVDQALVSEVRWPRPLTDPVTGLRYLSIWGRTDEGRAVMVVLRSIEGLEWYIAAARSLSLREQLEFEKWEAGR